MKLNYAFYPVNSTIIENESFGNKFYIIIKGKVSIQISKSVNESINFDNSPNTNNSNKYCNNLNENNQYLDKLHHLKSKSYSSTIDHDFLLEGNKLKLKDKVNDKKEKRMKINNKYEYSNNFKIIETENFFGELTIIPGSQK